MNDEMSGGVTRTSIYGGPTGAAPGTPGPSPTEGAQEPDAHGAARESEARREATERGKQLQRARDAGPALAAHTIARNNLDDLASRAFAALADNVRDYAIFLMDAEGIIVYWGEGARLVKGWTADEAEGGHLRMLYLDGGSEDGTAEDHLIEAAAQGESVSEGQRVRRDGSTFWAGVTLTALRGSDGALMGFAKVTRDLTARRAADAALMKAAEAERAKNAAEAVLAAKNQFVATMSHEIRTPINALLGYADLLASDVEGPLTEGQRRYVDRLLVSAHHLRELALDVVTLSRAEEERAPVQSAAGNLDTALDAALMLVEPQARARGVQVVNSVSTTAGGLSYWGEQSRVRQILVNILGNAVKFTEGRDELPPTVTVTAGGVAQPPALNALPGDGPWICVRIQDSGPGIPEDTLESIFQPFVQVEHGGKEREIGTGLGLAISRRLARRMGGDVTVESTVGVGSVFMLWLPVAAVESVQTGGA
ncbi:MAG TPA: PAS domain-containing sensor histidine kinase [Gemmatimonadaceae bacterium]|nr:PAS domain-containing sensor histidine kinase [Gemmatimonadaceae bacterium]